MHTTTIYKQSNHVISRLQLKQHRPVKPSVKELQHTWDILHKKKKFQGSLLGENNWVAGRQAIVQPGHVYPSGRQTDRHELSS